MNIQRLHFALNTEHKTKLILERKYSGLQYLLERLLNKYYKGKKIKNLIVYLHATEDFENLDDDINGVHYYRGYMYIYSSLEYKSFLKLSFEKQTEFLWKKVYFSLTKLGEKLKNKELIEAAQLAYVEGKEIKYNTDLKKIDEELIINKKKYQASVVIRFIDEKMLAFFILEGSDGFYYEKFIDQTQSDVEFFLIIYKKIQLIKDKIIIKGHYEIDYLPLKISFKEIGLI
jgi:hypothetical protein